MPVFHSSPSNFTQVLLWMRSGRHTLKTCYVPRAYMWLMCLIAFTHSLQTKQGFIPKHISIYLRFSFDFRCDTERSFPLEYFHTTVTFHKPVKPVSVNLSHPTGTSMNLETLCQGSPMSLHFIQLLDFELQSHQTVRTPGSWGHVVTFTIRFGLSLLLF